MDAMAAARRILIVDDQAGTRILLQDILEHEGYLVAQAGDGREALSMVRKEPPDLVLLDVMMPDLSGLQVTAEIRADPKLRRIPIVLCTAKQTLADVEKGLAAGADDYVVKPFDPAHVVAKIAQVLERPRPASDGRKSA